MANTFKTEIISPEKIIFSEDSKMVTFPSYEGDMSVLENHISLITFLCPAWRPSKLPKATAVGIFASDGEQSEIKSCVQNFLLDGKFE